MPTLTYNPEKHWYYMDDIWVPSVTQIISPLSSYGNIPARILEKAAARGRKIDEMCEHHLNGCLDEKKLSDELKMVLEQFNLFLEAEGSSFDFGSCITKFRGCNDRLKYAGESDFIIPEQAIIDVKCRHLPVMPLTDSLQLFGYEGIWSSNDPKGTKYQHFILSLYKDKYVFTELNKTKKEYNTSKSRFRYLLDKVWADIEFKQNIKNWK